MDNIINRISTIPVNITWIGIGSAVIRNTNKENMQQLPPFIEELYNNSNIKDIPFMNDHLDIDIMDIIDKNPLVNSFINNTLYNDIDTINGNIIRTN
jgi:hypothetical protein